MVPIQYNVRSLFVRKITTIATALGIALVVFVFAGTLMLKHGIQQALATNARSDTAIILRKGSDAELASTISQDLLGLFRGPAQVSQTGGGVIGELVVIITADRTDGSGISNLLIRGTPPEGMAFRPEVKIISGRAPAPGTNEVIVGKGISGRFKGVAPGQSFDVRRNRPLVVVGEFTAEGSSFEAEVLGDLDVIRRSLGREGVVSSARVRLSDPNAFEAYRATIEADKRFSMKVMRETDYFEKSSQETSKFLTWLGIALSIFVSIAAMLLAAITMNGAVANRSREIGTLRALGFSRFGILSSFLLEAIVLALIGGAVGLLGALALSAVDIPVMNFATFSEIVIAFRTSPGVIAWALGLSIVMGLVGGLIPAIRASRVSPVEAMRA
jgi:putative ABC transport system permease protein